VAVSPDTVDEVKRLPRKRNWKITLLADPSLEVIRLYGVGNRNFAPRRGPFRELAIPTTILLDSAGRVLWMEQTSDFRVRSQAERVLDQIRPLLSGSEAPPREMVPQAAPPVCEVCDPGA
jgi:peroxiredoxin